MLKCAGDMRTPSFMAIANCLLDVSFNYIFIYVLNMGVIGAALGTLLSYIIVSLGLAYMAIFRSKILGYGFDLYKYVYRLSLWYTRSCRWYGCI